MPRNQHVVPRGDQWAVLGEGAQRPTRFVPTQAEAIEIARRIARNQGTESLVHRPNGRIRQRDSHGSDQCPPRG